MLVFLNLPLIPLWVRMLRVPYPILFPLIVLFCLVGAYSLNNSFYDILVMLGFGILGYLRRKLKYEGAPLAMAFVLGPLLELNLRRSLIVSDGSFVMRPWRIPTRSPSRNFKVADLNQGGKRAKS